MPRVCSICTHAAREAIDLALVEDAPLRDIARRFEVSKDAAARHKNEHLPSTMLVAKSAAEDAHAGTLLDKVRALEGRARDIGQRAEQAGDLRVALGAVRELSRIVELQAKLAGELSDAPSVAVTLSADWLAMRTAILAALGPYPDARVAIARALGAEHLDA